jgi:DNA-binding beta-propeller fold protein YncE
VSDLVDQVDQVQVSTLTGSSASGDEDGLLAEARFNNPVNTAIRGQLLIVADFDNGAVRAIDLAQERVSTLYASVVPPFCRPFGLAFGAADELFVQTDCGPESGEYPQPTDGVIWRLDLGSPALPEEPLVPVNGRARGLVYLPADAEHVQGRLVFSDVVSHTVQVLDIDSGAVGVLAGMSGHPGNVDGRGSDARFYRPYGLARLGDDLIVADALNHVLRRVTLAGNVTTFAGTGCPGLVDGPAATARFNNPQSVATDELGNVYVSDGGNHRIRVIRAGTVRTLAGGAEAGFADGGGASARFYGQEGMDIASDGTALYIADGNYGEPDPYNRIRVLEVPPLD